MDLSLHAIVDHRRVPAKRVEGFLREAAAGGVTVVQVREKDTPTREALRYAETVRDIARELGMALAVDDRVDLALAVEADIVHLGRDDLPPHIVRRLAPGLAIGLSACNLEELEEVLAYSPAYVGYGPVFPTASKEDAGPPVGLAGLEAAVRRAGNCPVVAIGGISPDNAAAVWRTGVRGIAVISALTEAQDVQAAARALRLSSLPD